MKNTKVKKGNDLLLRELISILIRYTGERGDNEGAVECLKRICQEREILISNGVKNELLKLK